MERGGARQGALAEGTVLRAAAAPRETACVGTRVHRRDARSVAQLATRAFVARTLTVRAPTRSIVAGEEISRTRTTSFTRGNACDSFARSPAPASRAPSPLRWPSS